MKKIISLLLLSALIFSACSNDQLVVKPDETAVQPDTTIEKDKSSLTTSNVFVNNKYNYSFFYPKEASILSGDPVGYTSDSPYVFAYQKGDGQLFRVISENTKENLKTYTEKIWQINMDDIKTKPSKTVSSIEEVYVNNVKAYKFSLTLTFSHNNGGEVLKSPTTFIFTQNNDIIYEISYPSDNKKSPDILSSFKFIDSKTRITPLSHCKNQPDFNIDDCIFNTTFKWVIDNIYIEDDICNEIKGGTIQSAKCYWLFAMLAKDALICDRIDPVKGKGFFTRKNCADSINYTKGENSWKLQSGLPFFPNYKSLMYYGKADVQGWIEYDPVLKIHHIKITEESKQNIPPHMREFHEYAIEFYGERNDFAETHGSALPPDLLEKLKGSSENNPATISISQFNLSQQDGWPLMVIESINGQKIKE